MIVISIWLYGKPSWDLPIEGTMFFDPKVFVEHGYYLMKHLSEVSKMLKVLQENGWTALETYGELYCLDLFKEATLSEALMEIHELKIPLNKLDFEEIR